MILEKGWGTHCELEHVEHIENLWRTWWGHIGNITCAHQNFKNPKTPTPLKENKLEDFGSSHFTHMKLP